MVEGDEIASSASAGVDARRFGGAFTLSAEVKGDATPESSRLPDGSDRAPQGGTGIRPLQKVRNGVAADSFRRLQQNFLLLLQLGYYEGLRRRGDRGTGSPWSARGHPAGGSEVLVPERSSTAIYYRSEDATPVDPELAELDPQMQAMVRQALGQIQAETDANALRMGMEQMMQQATQAPQFKPRWTTC